MDLNYSPEDREFRATTRRWLESNIPKQELKTLDDRKAWHRKLYEAGYVGMLWPKEYGGWGATPMQQAIVQDEMARVSSPPAINGLGIGFIGPTIIVHGTEAQKKRYLKKMLTAEEIWCQLYSEPNAGSDLASLKTRAEDQGDHFVVNGQKIWTSSGPIADWGILLCRTDAKVAKHRGISCVLLNMRQPGVEVRPLKQITGESEFGEVFFEEARVPRANIVGKIGEGWRIAMTVLAYERGAMALAYSARYERDLAALATACREIGRTGQAVRDKLGRLVVENEVLRANGLRMLAEIAGGKIPGPEASLEKLYWSEFDQRFRETALDLLGPGGQLLRGSDLSRPEVDWGREFLWSRAETIFSGSSEVQRNILAKRALSLPEGPR